ncbi:MAG: hypothetical protein ACJ8F3_18605 [Xanthobacteraceae bacterium]
MTVPFRSACFALVLIAPALPANAQTWVYESDNQVTEQRYYEPRAYDPQVYYAPRATEGYAYEPAVTGQALALTPAQRTTIYRTIIPQGRGRGPIVRERIVTDTVASAPVVRERVVAPPAAAAYTVGSRVRDAYALAPLPGTVAASVPSVGAYRYMVINNRLLLVDPESGLVVADMTE